ncbi:MAG: hypothetical protein HY821_14635 [Acidobacteria bacterium]|nr:hypothetical protein [Acidobacteriota bacterium]
MLELRVAALLFFAAPVLLPGDPAPPRFEQYPVSNIFRGTPAAPILATPNLRAYRTRIRSAVKTGEGVRRPEGEPQHPGPNFAGRFILVEIMCGSPCLVSVLVDAVTGQIHMLPNSVGIHLGFFGGGPYLPELEFRLDSNILVIKPCPNDSPVEDHYSLWTGTRWKLLQRIPQPARKLD